MHYSIDSSTNLTFLAKLSDAKKAEEVWPHFVESYGKAIYQWVINWGASQADAEDIVQQTLLTVFLKVKQFHREGRFTFRTWIRQIARYTWLNVYQKASRTELLPVDEIDRIICLEKLKTSAAREDLINSFDQLACAEIRDLAFSRVRQRVNEQTWNIFFLFEHEGRSGLEIAEQFGVSHVAVRLAAFRVRQMLNEEVSLIDTSIIDML